MNKLFLLAVTLIFISYESTAQLTKEEEKELKSEIKSLSPATYKQLKDDLSDAQTKAIELDNQSSSMQQEINQLKSENAQLNSEVADYKKAAEAKVEEQRSSTPVAGDVADNYGDYEDQSSKGVIFKVQIGAFKNFDIRKYFGNHKNFSGEIDSDGTMKYTLGVFGDYWEADKFKKYLREMGVKGAWIVSYKDGKRVNIKDVLEGVI